MNYSLFIRPLIGAGIGYITNWIAVKMLFRPLNPIKLGKLTLPFTPGIIPKNKNRIAESIGKSISENLLTKDAIINTLLSEEKLDELKTKITNYLELSNNDFSLKDFLCDYTDIKTFEETTNSLKTYLSESIYSTVLDAKLNELIAEEIKKAAEKKLKGSLIGLFGGNSIISSITENVSISLNDYISTTGKVLINDMVATELNKYLNEPISSLNSKIFKTNDELVSIIINIYKKIITEKASKILENIDISQIVINQINSMDTLELEKIILKIMKKELNALVNLGALIGFLLGLLNLLI